MINNASISYLELTKRATKQPYLRLHYIDMKEELNNGILNIFLNKNFR